MVFSFISFSQLLYLRSIAYTSWLKHIYSQWINIKTFLLLEHKKMKQVEQKRRRRRRRHTPNKLLLYIYLCCQPSASKNNHIINHHSHISLYSLAMNYRLDGYIVQIAIIIFIFAFLSKIHPTNKTILSTKCAYL